MQYAWDGTYLPNDQSVEVWKRLTTEEQDVIRKSIQKLKPEGIRALLSGDKSKDLIRFNDWEARTDDNGLRTLSWAPLAWGDVMYSSVEAYDRWKTIPEEAKDKIRSELSWGDGRHQGWLYEHRNGGYYLVWEGNREG